MRHIEVMLKDGEEGALGKAVKQGSLAENTELVRRWRGIFSNWWCSLVVRPLGE